MLVQSAARRSLLVGVMLLGCARALPPPGGDPDETPPQIAETRPGEREVITDLTQAVVFRFNERISERGVREAILVSPATGATPRVERGRSEIRVEMPGGWKPDHVYRVVLLPGVRDLFGNERREPAGLVFSTGPAIPNTAVAGVVLDRMTGRPAQQVVVQAARVADSVVYSTVGDSSAFYALTNLPLGQYRIAAFLDQNRNHRRDPSESASRPHLATLDSDADTVPLVLSVVPADTTSARLTRAEARDSVEVRLTFDDALDPDVPLEDARVSLFALPDTTPVGGALRLMRVDDYEKERRARAPRAPPDSAITDTTRREAPPRRPPDAPPELADSTTGPLPVRELVLLTTTPLTPGARYLLRAEGFTNVTGISEGGGSADFEAPERTAPVRRDTTAALSLRGNANERAARRRTRSSPR